MLGVPLNWSSSSTLMVEVSAARDDMWGPGASETGREKRGLGLIGFWATSNQPCNGECRAWGGELGWLISARGEKQVRLKRWWRFMLVLNWIRPRTDFEDFIDSQTNFETNSILFESCKLSNIKIWLKISIFWTCFKPLSSHTFHTFFNVFLTCFCKPFKLYFDKSFKTIVKLFWNILEPCFK